MSATPNGRKEYTPLSDGASASQGCDAKGPTAVLVSNYNSKNYDYRERASRLVITSYSIHYTKLYDNFPAYFAMDPVRLRQVLINLIGNALKFTENGSIHLKCHDVRIDEENETIDFTISVTDTGIGIV